MIGQIGQRGYLIAINRHDLLEAKYPTERKKPMLKPIVTYVGIIHNIQNRRDLMLITDP
jgi:hypothetical protein